MTKLIKELAGNALDKVVPETWTTLTPEQLDKFTEELSKLIVQECMNTCKEVETELADIYEHQELECIQIGTRYCYEAILDKFGVEE